MTEVAGQRFRLYTTADLGPVIERMARQALLMLDPAQRPVVVGVLRRGAPLADMMVAAMRAILPGFSVDRLDLKVKRYSDDLKLLHPETRLDTPSDAPTIRDRQVLVVDDVLYQGYSFFRVFEFLRAEGARTIRSAVLADRCVAQVPIRADIVGASLQIAPGDVIECSVPPYESEFAMDVLRPD
ncbi:MAG: phosphoribosyltransferase [Xanthomonadales bacterium]|nr:Bifunctional protein PyrR [Xanthomonadales bacterium]MCC6593302.1 phosphoribosyltransferase [Xanthomonadales bacterium]MCE7930489.1 phosphoribosyltransferase [Xanthomonadales bacterium PRO6]